MKITEVKLSSVGLSRKEWGEVESAAKANLETKEETILIPDPRFTHTMLEGDTWERGDATPSESAFLLLLATILEGNPSGPAELYLDPTLPDLPRSCTVRRVYQTESPTKTMTDETREVVLYALTYLHSNMSEEVTEDMKDFITPDAIIEDEIVGAIEAFSALNPTTTQ